MGQHPLYRAWINKLGTYVDVQAIGVASGRTFPVYTHDHKYTIPTQGVLERWTGITDDAGVPIYAGDIVQVEDIFQGENTWVTQVVSDEGYMFGFRGNLGGLWENIIDEERVLMGYVIGNVHEDSDNLEGNANELG